MKITNHYLLAAVLLLCSLVSAAQIRLSFSPTRIPLDSAVLITVKGRSTHFTDASTVINFHNNAQYGYTEMHKGISISDITVLNDTLLTLRVKLARHIIPSLFRCYLVNQSDRVLSDSTLQTSSPFIAPTINQQAIRDQYNVLLLNCANFNLNNDTVLSLSFSKNQVPLANITIDSLRKHNITTALCWVFIPYTIKPDTYELNLTTSKQGVVPGAFVIAAPFVYGISPSPLLKKNDSTTIQVTTQGMLFTKGTALPYIFNAQSADTISAYSFQVVNNNNIKASFYIPGTADTGRYHITVYDTTNGYVTRNNALEIRGASLSRVNVGTFYRDSVYHNIMLKGINTHFKKGTNTVLAYKNKLLNAGLQVEVKQVIDDTTLLVSVTADRFAPSGPYTLAVINQTETAPGNFNLHVQGALRMNISGMLRGNQHNKIALYGQGKKSDRLFMIAFRQNPTMRIFAVAAKDTFRTDSFSVVNDTLVYAYFNMPFKLPARTGTLFFEDSINGKFSASVSLTGPGLLNITPMEFVCGDTLMFTMEGEGNVFDSMISISFKHLFDTSQNKYVAIDSLRKISPNLLQVFVRTDIRAATGFFPVLHFADTSTQHNRYINVLQPWIFTTPQQQKFSRMPVRTITFSMRNARNLRPDSVWFTTINSGLLHSIKADSFYRTKDTLLHVVASISDTMRSGQRFFMRLKWNNGSIAQTELQLIAPQLNFIVTGNLKTDTQHVFYYKGENFDISDLQVDFYDQSSVSANFLFPKDSVTMTDDTLRIYTSIARSAAGTYTIRLSKPYDGVFNVNGRFFVDRYGSMFEYDDMKVTSYPNPVSSDGVIHLALKQLPAAITFVSANGQAYTADHAEQNGTTVKINLKKLKLAGGLYVMRIEQADGTRLSHKVMVNE